MRTIPTTETMMRRYENDKAKVLSILRQVPCTRGDDRLLHHYVCRNFYGIDTMHCRMSWAQFRGLPSEETLARRRREWQAVYPHLQASERTQIKRSMRMQAFKELYQNEQQNMASWMEG
jgi:hypothetical protein